MVDGGITVDEVCVVVSVGEVAILFPVDKVDVSITVVVNGRDTDDGFLVTIGVVTVGIVIVVGDVGDDFSDEVGVDIVVGVDTDMDMVDFSKLVSTVFAADVKDVVDCGDVCEFDAVTDNDGSDLIVVVCEVEAVDEIAIVFDVDVVCVSRVVAGTVFVILVEDAEVVLKVNELDVGNRSEDGTVLIVSVIVDVIVPAEEVGVVIIKVEVGAILLVVKIAVCVSNEVEVITVVKEAREEEVAVVVTKDEGGGVVFDIISDGRGEVLSVSFAVDDI